MILNYATMTKEAYNKPATAMKSEYLTAWRQRFARQRAERIALAEQAHAALPAAVAILRKHGAKRVWVNGSLCQPEKFHPGSDIDLAVEGIAPKDFNRAGADLMMAMDWPVDLKPFEELSPSLFNRILQSGRVIYAQ